MRSHREICSGQPCGCCRYCGEWRWRGNTCLGCGRGPAGEPAVDQPKKVSDLVSLFDTQLPTAKSIGTGEDLV